MRTIELEGCTTRPLGSYLKALGVLRLVSEQADGAARGWWQGDSFRLCSTLEDSDLVRFFIETYRPTPILAPWNGGSGFYEKDRKIGIETIAKSADGRFTEYRSAINFLRRLPEVNAGKKAANEEEERRTAILLAARNCLPDSAVEWLDAAVGLAADGSRSFAPILGTGGNEGRLDYTNNFMERVASLLLTPEDRGLVRKLLENSLFARQTDGLQPASVGQFDPGRTGGFNQGEGIETSDVRVNPWDFVLTLEGAVAWASGLYRRQGVSYRRFFCSPFTVGAIDVGYGSSAAKDAARAELWTPVWQRPCRYAELKVLLREGRASIDQRPAFSALQFAEAACSLGVDRGISHFVRYSLVKRRGDSYIALPAGLFPTAYRTVADRIRELSTLLDRLDRADLPDSVGSLRRRVDAAIYDALLRGGSDRLRTVMLSFGRVLRFLAQREGMVWLPPELDAAQWIADCGETREVRMAAALASIYDRDSGGIRENLFAGARCAWTGRNLADRMVSVLEKRLRTAVANESEHNPLRGACQVDPGDVTLFVEGSVDDSVIEDLLFAFTCLNWKGYSGGPEGEHAEVLPVFAMLKHLFLASPVEVNGESKLLRADARIPALLRARHLSDAADLAVHRLRVAGLNPLEVEYRGGVDPLRLAASLLVPVRTGAKFSAAVLRDREEVAYR